MGKERYLKGVEDRLNATILDREAMTTQSQRDGLLAELQRKDSQREKDLRDGKNGRARDSWRTWRCST